MLSIPTFTHQVAHDHQRELRHHADVARMTRTKVAGRIWVQLRRAALRAVGAGPRQGEQPSVDVMIEPAP